MEAYKKAALHLYGLNTSDRGWILEKLPGHQRERLISMLDELGALGIPQESILFSDLDEPDTDSRSADNESKTIDTPPHISIIAQADPAWISAVLNAETDATVATVLKAHDWPWRQAVLKDFPRPRRRGISERAKQSERRPTDRVCDVVLQILAERIVGDPTALSMNDTVAHEPGKSARRWIFMGRR